MARPRNSVLNLFDPLNSPAASSSRQKSPSPDSDKENILPRGGCFHSGDVTLTSFFCRTTKPCYQPTIPRMRLVDVGDVTIDEEHAGTVEPDGMDACDAVELSFDEADADRDRTFVPQSPSTPRPSNQQPKLAATPQNKRSPLTELDLERDFTPVARKNTVKALAQRRSSTDYARAHTPVSVADLPSVTLGTKLESVINKVNSSGLSFAQTGSARKIADSSAGDRRGARTPDIVISASPDDLASSLSDLRLTESTAALLKDTPIPIICPPSPPPSSSPREYASSSSHLLPVAPRLRGATSTSSLDPRRSSADLQASFNLQLQCPEASFDLLNDKISFFSAVPGMDSVSFLSDADGGDDSFDMEVEEEKMEKFLCDMAKEELAEKEKEKESAITPATVASDPPLRAADAQTRVGLTDLPSPTFRHSKELLDIPRKSPPSLANQSSVMNRHQEQSLSNARPMPSRVALEENFAEKPASEQPVTRTAVSPPLRQDPPGLRSLGGPDPTAGMVSDAPSELGSFQPAATSVAVRNIPPSLSVATVSALRIVKRSKLTGHEKTASSSGSDSRASSATPESEAPAPQLPSVAAPRPVARTQTLPSTRQSTSTSFTRDVRASRTTAPAAAPPVPTISARSGPGAAVRVPITAPNAGPAPTSVRPNPRLLALGANARGQGAAAAGGAPVRPMAAAGAPARAPVLTRAVSAPAPAPVSGLRQPAKYSGGSALPRPVAASRMPVPGRVGAAGGVASGSRAKDAPLRRIA